MESGGIGAGVERAFAGLSERFESLLPNFLTALVLLLVGWIVGRLLRWLTVRLIARLGRIRSGRAVERAVRSSGVERVASEVVGRVVFWTVFVFFAAAAGEVLGLAVASSGLSLLVRYLPSVLAAVLIFLGGLVLSNLAREAVVTAATTAGLAAAPTLGKAARGTILLLAAVVALDQLGIDSTLLILAVGILLAAVIGSAALAFGLGARTEVSNIVALHYLSRSYGVGQRVRVGEVRGRILEFTTTGVLLDTREGRMLVPAKEFSEQVSWLLTEETA